MREELSNLGFFQGRVVKQAITLGDLSELLAGAVVFHGCEAVFDFLVVRPGSVTEIPTRFFFLAFTIVPPFLFCLLTLWLYRRSRNQPYTVWPELNLIAGSIIFVPIYFKVASHLIYHPRPMDLREEVEGLISMYAIFPLAVMSLMVYSFSITPLILIVISTTVTGWVVRRRSRSRRELPAKSLPTGPSGSPSAAG